MTGTSNPALAAWVATLDTDAREFFEERAAILEYEAGLSRPDAETRAQQLTDAYRQRREGRDVSH